jgi:uncharacterized protein (TIGR00255 family)
MISSMTGFARAAAEAAGLALVWELKTVNQRYLEVSFRLPEPFRQFEVKWRKKIQERLKRGKLECVLKLVSQQEASAALSLNESVLVSLQQACQQVNQTFVQGLATPTALDVLAWPGVVLTGTDGVSEAQLFAVEAELDTALTELVAMRAREGEGLAAFLQQRLQRVRELVAEVTSVMPEILAAQREKVCSRFEELSVTVEADRLEQEMVWLMQRSDVAEELARLESHVTEVESTLAKGGVVGRRLDFLMQELNREANTLGSKSIHATLTNVSVELKVLIEQMREQVQNIE